MQDKDSTRGSINKRMTVVHRCIRTPNIVLSVRPYLLVLLLVQASKFDVKQPSHAAISQGKLDLLSEQLLFLSKWQEWLPALFR